MEVAPEVAMSSPVMTVTADGLIPTSCLWRAADETSRPAFSACCSSSRLEARSFSPLKAPSR